MGFLPGRIAYLPASANRSLKRPYTEDNGSTTRQSRQRLSITHRPQQLAVPESAATAANIPRYPIGFPSPPVWFESYFDDWAALWRNAHGARPASTELCRVLEQFVADMPATARRLEFVKDNLAFARQTLNTTRGAMLPSLYNWLRRALDDMDREYQEKNSVSERTRELVDFLQTLIEKYNTDVVQKYKRLEEAHISLGQAHAKHAAYMAQHSHICTVQDVERVLWEQCNLEQSAVGHDT